MIIQCVVFLSSTDGDDHIELRKNFNLVSPSCSPLLPSAPAIAAVGHGLWRVIRRGHRLLVYTSVRACLGGVLLSTHAHHAQAAPPPYSLRSHSTRTSFT